MSAANDRVRRQLGGMPTGHYDLNENQFRIVRHEPVEQDAQTVPLNGVVLCVTENESDRVRRQLGFGLRN